MVFSFLSGLLSACLMYEPFNFIAAECFALGAVWLTYKIIKGGH